jgi:hemerythrin-like domain-containing protein
MDRGPFDQLRRSHERLREELAEIDRAIESASWETLAAACDFFERNVVRHEKDEEASLFPRLTDAPPEVQRAIASLCEEHREHEGFAQAFRDVIARRATSELRPFAAKIRASFERHIALEEGTVFPYAETSIATDAHAQMQDEMDARRGRGGGGGGGGGGRGKR